MLALVSILFLGLPVIVFVILFLLDRELSLSLTKFLRFCKFVITGGIQALVIGYGLVIFISPKSENWAEGFLLLGVFLSIGNIVGYIRYRRFAKEIESNPEILVRTSQVSFVESFILFFSFFVAGYILYGFNGSNPYSHIQNEDVTTVVRGLVVLSAFLTFLIQWLRYRNKAKKQ